MSKINEKYKKLAIIVSLIIILDQATKTAILKWLPLYHSIDVIKGFFSLTHIHNPGGAFGLLANQSEYVRAIFFLFIASIATCLIFYFYITTPKTHSTLATGFALIFGGALGNLIDRIRFGEVVDFLDFYVGNFHWHTFNVADGAVSIGIVIFAYHLFFKKLPCRFS